MVGDVGPAFVGGRSVGADAERVPVVCRIMQQLLQNLSSPKLNREVKPDILNVFGDMAQGLGVQFDRYISQVVETLQAAMNIAFSNQMAYQHDTDPDEALIIYNNELRSAIVQSAQGPTPACASHCRCIYVVLDELGCCSHGCGWQDREL